MERYNTTRRVAILGIAANIVLLVLKLSIGFITRSQAMIADGFNSAGDVFASIMTFVGNKIASKPEDEQHPYGHGKAEYVFSMIISFSLLLVAYQILTGAIDSLIKREYFTFSWWLVGIGIFTILLKLCLYIYTRIAGKKLDNLLILANSEDHRNDVFVTLSTLIGIGMGQLGIFWVDGVVGIAISLWIGFTGIRIFLSSYEVLMDTTIDHNLHNDVLMLINTTEGVDHVDTVTAKPVGVGFIVIVKVSVKGDLTVNQSHIIAAQIKHKIKDLKNVEDVVVHINPA